MSSVRFLDNVAVESFAGGGGNGVDVYLSGSLIGSNILQMNFTGSGVDIELSGSTGVLITITGSGTQGPPGPSGSAGPSGSSGPEGNLAIWQYTSSTNMTTDPGVGYFKIDTTWAGNTSEISFDDYSYSPSVYLKEVLDSISIGSVLKVASVSNSNIYKYLQVTSTSPAESGYEKFGVTQLATNGSVNDGDQIGLSIPSTAANNLEIIYNGSQILSSALTLNFSGSGVVVTDNGGGTALITIPATFPYTGSAIISGSLSVEGPFLVSMNDGNGDSNKLQVNNEGVTVLGKLDTTPTAVTGGIFYSASNEFFFGFE